MPNITIKCRWCGEEFYNAKCGYRHSIHMCLVHEHKCDKNPENNIKLPIATLTTSIYGPRVEVYLPTNKDKKLAEKILSDYHGNVWTNIKEETVELLFKRLGLIE
jgi:hypothetical protein